MHRWLSAAVPLALAAAALSFTLAQEPKGVSAQISLIKKVGREGKGNAEAARAWKLLVAQGTPALIPILKAMEDDALVSSNWLRPAFEAIAEKTLNDGKALPKVDLEKFLEDTRNAGSARRLAYEWLVKIDKNVPERYLPKMLLDPSSELRRDAVARAIKDADTLAEQKDENAKAAYRRALTGACDEDQVETIAKALDKLGEKVDVAKHLGFITTWHLVAPFEHHKGVGWDKAYPPEKAVDLTATYDGKDNEKVKWVAHTTKDAQGQVDLAKALGPFKGSVGYGYVVVESEKKQEIELRAGCPTGLKIFLNGKEIFAREEYHHGSRIDQYTARGVLNKGKNEILVKVCQNEQKEQWAQSWKFQLRLCDYTGVAVPVTVAAPAKKENK